MTAGGYERICNEFGVSPHSDWKVSGPNQGLGRVYNYWANNGYHPVGAGEYDSSRMSFTKLSPRGFHQAGRRRGRQCLENVHT